MKRQRLVQFVFKSVCFLRSQICDIKIHLFSILKTPNKQMMVFFRTRLGKTLIWQKFS